MSTDIQFIDILRMVDAKDVVSSLESYYKIDQKIFGITLNAVNASILPGDFAILDKLDAAMPEDFAFRSIVDYARARISAHANDVVSTAKLLRITNKVAAPSLQLFGHDEVFSDFLGALLQQSFAIDPEAAKSLTYATADLVREEPEANRPVVVFAVASGANFDRYATDFIASAKALPDLLVHIHVINPTDQTQKLFDELTADAGGRIALTSETGPDHATHYASKRLLMARQIMNRYRADLLITEIDTLLLPSFVDVRVFFDGWDGGLFERDEQRSPLNLCHPALVFLANTLATWRILSLVESYLSAKLKTRAVEFLDVYALFTITGLAQSGDLGELWADLPLYRWINLSHFQGPPLKAFNPQQPDADVNRPQTPKYDVLSDDKIKIDYLGRPVFQN